MTRHLPVRSRLTLAFAVVIAIVLTATGVFVHGRLASSLDAAIENSLRARVADVGALAQQSERGLSETGSDGAARRHIPALAQLVDARGRVIDRTPGLPATPLLSAAALERARAGHAVMRDAALGDDRVRLIAEPVIAQDQRMVVIAGQSLEDREHALSNLTGVLEIGGPAALALATLAGYLLTGAALAPVESLRRRAEEISGEDLTGRLPSAGGDDELGRLGRTLNEMLERITTAVARERSFVADASHELRSPLAVLRTELEMLKRERPTGAALQAAAGSAIEETDRLTALVDDLLLLARADDGSMTIRPAKLLVAELLQKAADRAGDPRVRTSVDAPAEAVLHADAARLEQALDNIVSNALRYATAEVVLAARSRDGHIALHVLDDGPGFPEGFIPRAWERFARADAGRSEDGAGLGLSIVSTIAEAHGGRAGAGNRSSGGADVWIELPAAELPAAGPSRTAAGIARC